ncbi:hypothetical protein NVP1189B_65 [Vibrio phage 1.189.B._10N.286.51.B5]|nr:hypothetical protein NVP1189B_65 [Vibrio phage 1.189.B._10N.286.51.B5]AUR93957.1 hypothetical protein NVP1189C_65 [Vibrio phage 1.189.C._10N.286.51.B5]AUR94023.1 hypothetical protein NVP1189O_65 [Vibrio phage 1.189.O._10N.286.51.B5]
MYKLAKFRQSLKEKREAERRYAIKNRACLLDGLGLYRTGAMNQSMQLVQRLACASEYRRIHRELYELDMIIYGWHNII